MSKKVLFRNFYENLISFKGKKVRPIKSNGSHADEWWASADKLGTSAPTIAVLSRYYFRTYDQDYDYQSDI